MTTKLLSLEDLKRFFNVAVGPVFCFPSKQLIHRYKKMEGMLGLILPIRSHNDLLLDVDWSLDCNWEHVLSCYPPLKNQGKYTLSELNIINPMSDIPQVADTRYKTHNWEPDKRGDVVCISRFMFAVNPGHIDKPQAFHTVLPLVGVVSDRCQGDTSRLMVNFHGEGTTKILNMPKSFLMKLPNSFMKATYDAQSKPVKPKHNFGNMTPKSTNKFELDDIVRVSASVMDEEYMGLLGVVTAIHVKPAQQSYAKDTFEYSVDLDVLPNRNVTLILGEKTTAITQMRRFREFDLDEWDEKVTDKAHLGMFRQRNKRDKVWVLDLQGEASIEGESKPKKSLAHGMSIKVKHDGAKYETSCRNLDYKWDIDALTAAMSDGFIALGVEEDQRNPNEKGTWAYLYVFELAKDVGKRVKYRVLLGQINPKRSNVKKFAKSLLTGKLKHPWHVYRYLMKDTLGFFYSIYSADDYLKEVGEFYDVE